MKKKLFIFALALALLAVGVAGTAAYFSAEDTAHNVITMGSISVDIIEKQLVEGKLVDYPHEASAAMPGSTVSKIVSVKNHDGSSSAWIRAAVVVTAVDPNGETVSSKVETKNGTEPAVSFTPLDGWTDGGDGWYYYELSVEHGETTEPLFNEITFSGNMDNAYKNCTVTVDVIAQAVQTANNPIPDGGSVCDVAGWPAE